MSQSLENMSVQELLEKKRKKRETLHTGPREKPVEAHHTRSPSKKKGKRKVREESSHVKQQTKKAKTKKTVQTSHSAPKPVMPSSLTVKCRPRGLFEIINFLNESQRKAVCDIGFGGLLHLGLTSIPLDLVPLFVENFNPESYLFKAGEIKFFLSKHDVYDVFCLPRGNVEVPLVATGGSSQSTEDQSLKGEWRSKFQADGKGKIGVHLLHERILSECGDGGDEFKRLFVVYAMSIFLAPTSNNTMDIQLVKSVEDVSRIAEYDWCAFVFQQFISALRSCKGGAVNLKGCIVLLMVAYFHRVEFRGEIPPQELPLIRHWDDKTFDERSLAEFKSGSLGNGSLSSGTFPICMRTVSKEAATAERPLLMPPPAKKKTCVEEPSKVVSAPITGKTYMEFPSGFETDDQILARAADKIEAHILMMKRDFDIFYQRTSQRREAIKAELEGVVDPEIELSSHVSPTPTMFRDPILLAYWDTISMSYKAMMNTAEGVPTFEYFKNHMYNPNEPVHNLVVDCNPSTSNLARDSIDDDSMGADDEIHLSALDNLVNNVCNDAAEKDIRVTADEEPMNVDEVVGKTEKISQSAIEAAIQAEPEPISEHGNETHVEAEQILEHGNEIHAKAEKISQSTNEVAAKEVTVFQSEQVAEQIPEEVPVVTSIESIGTSYLLHSVEANDCMSVVPCNFGCDDYCLEADKDAIVVSEFLITNKEILEPMRKLRKDAIDFCFLDDHTFSEEEMLVIYGYLNMITRSDFLTLMNNTMITSPVVDCWCVNLNHIIYHAGSSVPSRAFMWTNHSNDLAKLTDSKGDEDALSANVIEAFGSVIQFTDHPFNWDAELFFIPLHYDEHFSCIVINFRDERLDYLDNRIYENKDNRHFRGAKRAAAIFAEFMIGSGHEKGRRIKSFTFAEVLFEWSAVCHENLDCGVFLMLHMLFYNGKPFQCDLGDPQKRILYRAEIGAILFLSSLNQRKTELLQEIMLFTETKASLLPSLLKKREEQKIKDAQGTKTKARPAPKKIVGYSSFGSPRSERKLSNLQQYDGLGCSIKCGEPKEDMLMASVTMIGSSSLTKNILFMKKQFLDYLFLDDYNLPENELVFSYKHHVLLRRDLITIGPDHHMDVRIVNCWSLLMNYMEEIEESKIKMFFFGIDHIGPMLELLDNDEDTPNDHAKDKVFKFWDLFLEQNVRSAVWDSDLFFIPLKLGNHYFCACVNYKNSTVDVLDNTFHKDFQNSQFCKLAEIAASCLEDYLEILGSQLQKDAKNSRDLLNMPIRNIRFKWQTPAANDKESGLFLLVHMLNYEGELYMSEVGKKLERRYYWFECTAMLLLCDINKERKCMMKKIKDFILEKPSIVDKVLEERRKGSRFKKPPRPPKK